VTAVKELANTMSCVPNGTLQFRSCARDVLHRLTSMGVAKSEYTTA